MVRILEMFESTSQSAFKFIQDAQDPAKWLSPAQALYLSGSEQGHRFLHLLSHFTDRPGNGVRVRQLKDRESFHENCILCLKSWPSVIPRPPPFRRIQPRQTVETETESANRQKGGQFG
jgi:hypothetical protein